jgi:hypothetical protein
VVVITGKLITNFKGSQCPTVLEQEESSKSRLLNPEDVSIKFL